MRQALGTGHREKFQTFMKTTGRVGVNIPVTGDKTYRVFAMLFGYQRKIFLLVFIMLDFLSNGAPF